MSMPPLETRILERRYSTVDPGSTAFVNNLKEKGYVTFSSERGVEFTREAAKVVNEIRALQSRKLESIADVKEFAPSAAEIFEDGELEDLIVAVHRIDDEETARSLRPEQ